MLYFVHRLNTNMFLNMSIKLKAAISKLLACVIVAFFVGKITLNRLSLYNEHLNLNTKKLIDFCKFNQHFHSIYCSNINTKFMLVPRTRFMTNRNTLKPFKYPLTTNIIAQNKHFIQLKFYQVVRNSRGADVFSGACLDTDSLQKKDEPASPGSC